MRIRLVRVLILLNLFLLVGIVFLPNITKIKPKPATSLGFLWVNRFKLAMDLRNVSKVFNKTNTNRNNFFKHIGEDLKFAELDNQGIRMGETGITYKCERYSDTSRVIISLDKNKINHDKSLLAKRIYLTLLECKLSKVNLTDSSIQQDESIINYIINLVLKQNKLSPIVIF